MCYKGGRREEGKNLLRRQLVLQQLGKLNEKKLGFDRCGNGGSAGEKRARKSTGVKKIDTDSRTKHRGKGGLRPSRQEEEKGGPAVWKETRGL